MKVCCNTLLTLSLECVVLVLNFVIEVDGNCDDRLVSGSNGVRDEDMTSPVNHSDPRCHAKWGRLTSGPGYAYCGSAANSYLQVKFRDTSVISAIITQGRVGFGQYVKTYQLSISMDGQSWTNITNDNGDLLFNGTDNANEVAERHFDKTYLAKFLRVNIVTSSSIFGLKMDVVGCSVIPQQGVNNFKCWKGRLVTQDLPILFETSAENAAECGKLCFVSNTCMSFSFDAGSQTCKGHTQRDDDSLQNNDPNHTQKYFFERGCLQ